ncbi:MAG: FAD-dependent pyridine nucleotide-disulfide oxidoreductase [Thermoleophilia bacterium]|nr:FAD-dependent pyridine nucleotide-disulfide oxidoreductase [Thermoleophilia bacterium]
MDSSSSPSDVADVTIIGGGPTGLAAAYYAGHREASVRIIDTLPELGGQVMAMYPEKHIFDVAGHPKIKASELVRLQVEQASQFDPEVVLEEDCETLEHLDAPDEPSGQLVRLRGASGREYLTRTVIVTAGHGAFEPRRLPIEGIERWNHHGLHYLVKRTAEFAGKRVVIVGGGDSALDWTLGLQDVVAHPITLVHRRDRFRALEHSVTQMRALVEEGKVDLRVPCEVTAIHGSDHVQSVTIANSEDGTEEIVECDALITLLGFKSALGSIANWGLEFHSKKAITVDPASMETNLPCVFAAGDVAGYDGKITLITIGMGEAAIAANRAITVIRPEAKAQPKYSTE